jgi:hypothetical protein
MDAKELLRKKMEDQIKSDPRGFMNDHVDLAQALNRAMMLFDASKVLGHLFYQDESERLHEIGRKVLTDIGLEEKHIEALLEATTTIPALLETTTTIPWHKE